jgi:hypothetical protein
MSASGNHEKDLNYPRYLRILNNAPNNVPPLPLPLFILCLLHRIWVSFRTYMAATHKDHVETMNKTQEHFSRLRPMQLKLQRTQTTTPNNTKQHRRTQIERKEESDNERPRSAGLGRGGGPGAQGKWRRSQYCCRVRVGKFKLTKSYFFQLPLRCYHSPSHNCPTSQKQMFNENST